MKSKSIKRIIRLLIPTRKIKVDLFLVGAQKAGTSSLHNYLTKHIDIKGGKKKEINFFNHKENYKTGYNYYHKNFRASFFFSPKKIFIDSTPQYLSDLSVAQKIHHYNPNAKIVILLREPSSRAYSAWNMYKQFSELTDANKKILIKRHISLKERKRFSNFINQNPFPDFEHYIDNELNKTYLNNYYPNILKKGIYYDQVKLYQDLFGFDNVLIFESDYFKMNKIQVVNEITSLLDIRSTFLKEKEFKNIHSRDYDKPMNNLIQKKLKEFYRPHNRKLFNLLNLNFDW